jgi:hypothetical protein
VKKISLIESSEKKKISKRTLSLLRYWAMEAYKIDPSKPVSRYYQYFLDRYYGTSESIKKDELFEEKPIEI